MEAIIQSILWFVVIILEFMLYFILAAVVAPKILRSRCPLRESRDRGLKKYAYPDGRAVLYEPHPSLRKYVSRYLLLTQNGYKYFRCKPDASVERMQYSIVMFNNRNRVIDVIDVAEERIREEESAMVMLHPDTSYISLALCSVNGICVKHEKLVCCRFWQLAAFTAAMCALSFAHMTFMTRTVAMYDAWWGQGSLVARITPIYLLIPSVGIGAVAGALAFLNHRAKGIRWSR